MTVYGENEGQGKYWNEKPGQSWVTHDASMNERLSSISEILFEGLDVASCKTGSLISVVVQVQQQDDCINCSGRNRKWLVSIFPSNC